MNMFLRNVATFNARVIGVAEEKALIPTAMVFYPRTRWTQAYAEPISTTHLSGIDLRPCAAMCVKAPFFLLGDKHGLPHAYSSTTCAIRRFPSEVLYSLWPKNFGYGMAKFLHFCKWICVDRSMCECTLETMRMSSSLYHQEGTVLDTSTSIGSNIYMGILVLPIRRSPSRLISTPEDRSGV